jgi:hypothetical protein
MANDYYQIYNHAYSFSSSTVNSGGLTYSLPQNDYGIYGQHVDAFFNTISRSAGATGSLAVWFVSDKGLTFYTHSLGATAAITGYVQGRFPVTSSTTGLGLIDLRGSPDWTKIVGDGIVGPTRGSTGSVAGANATQYVNGIKAVFGVLKSQYPKIDWAIAGLPHLPYVMAYAPPIGQSPVWDASLTNSGGYTAPTWWDPAHPTGSSAANFYSWIDAPQELQEFYEKVVTDGIQEMVFDNCAVDWLCPDIRVPYTDSLPFYEYGNNYNSNYNRNKKLCELSFTKARSLLVQTYPLLSTMYPSRPLTRYDDPKSQYTITNQVTGNNYINIDGSSYVGVTANASEDYYSSLTYRHDMLQAAIDGNSDGFIFFDPMPSVIEIACTGDIAVGATGYDAQIRARNMFSSMMYGGTYVDGYVPSGSGYADPCVKAELLRFASKRTVGYLDDIRESVNLAGHGNSDKGNLSGWIRGAKNPILKEVTYDIKDSSNTTASDSIYGEQYWQQKQMVDCECPIDCESPNNPYRTQGGAMGCCCISLYRLRPFSDKCLCPPWMIRGVSINSDQCNTYAANCECETFTVNLAGFFSNDPECENSTCIPSVGIQSSCNCLNFTFEGGICDNPPCLICTCDGTEEDLIETCDDAVPLTEGKKNIWKEIDYALILDMKTYKRSSFDTKTFLLTRSNNEKYSNWSAIYKNILTPLRHPSLIQARVTILKPTVSTAALRTQFNKEVLRHLPNQYFTT